MKMCRLPLKRIVMRLEQVLKNLIANALEVYLERLCRTA